MYQWLPTNQQTDQQSDQLLDLLFATKKTQYTLRKWCWRQSDYWSRPEVSVEVWEGGVEVPGRLWTDPAPEGELQVLLPGVVRLGEPGHRQAAVGTGTGQRGSHHFLDVYLYILPNAWRVKLFWRILGDLRKIREEFRRKLTKLRPKTL